MGGCQRRIRTGPPAVVPAAGRGLRMRPLTRSVPKPLLPVGGAPVLVRVLEELAAAGVPEAVVVVPEGDPRIPVELARRGPPLPVAFVEQPRPRGLGDAVLRAGARIGGGPCLVALPDALFPPGTGSRPLERLLAAAGAGDATLLVAPLREGESGMRGVVTAVEGPAGELRVVEIAEKPEQPPPDARWCTAGRLVVGPRVLRALRGLPPPPGGELGLTEAIARVVAEGGVVRAVPLLPGERRLDTGHPAGYREAEAALSGRGRGYHPGSGGLS